MNNGNTQQGPQEGQFLILHMKSGEIILGAFAGQDENEIIIDVPHNVVLGQQPDGRPGVRGFAPFLSFGGMFGPLPRIGFTHLDYYALRPCPQPIEDAFREATGGIQVARKSTLIVPS